MPKKIKKYQKVYTGDDVILNGERYICIKGLDPRKKDEFSGRGKHNFLRYPTEFGKVEGKGFIKVENTKLSAYGFKFYRGRPGPRKKPAEEKLMPFFTNLLPRQVKELKALEEKYHRGQGEITREVITIGIETLKKQP